MTMKMAKETYYMAKETYYMAKETYHMASTRKGNDYENATGGTQLSAICFTL